MRCGGPGSFTNGVEGRANATEDGWQLRLSLCAPSPRLPSARLRSSSPTGPGSSTQGAQRVDLGRNASLNVVWVEWWACLKMCYAGARRPWAVFAEWARPGDNGAPHQVCLLLPFHCPFTALLLPCYCLLQPFHCPFTALSLPFHCLSLPFTALSLPFHHVSLPFHCPFTALHRSSTALSLPFTALHCLSPYYKSAAGITYMHR